MWTWTKRRQQKMSATNILVSPKFKMMSKILNNGLTSLRYIARCLILYDYITSSGSHFIGSKVLFSLLKQRESNFDLLPKCHITNDFSM